jgi:hypothetical protein
MKSAIKINGQFTKAAMRIFIANSITVPIFLGVPNS